MPILAFALSSLVMNYNNDMIDLGGKFAWGLDLIYYRTHNQSKKEAKRRCKQKQEQNSRNTLQEQNGLPEHSTIWHRVKFSPHNLFSSIPWLKDKPTHHPTPKEVESAFKQIQSYWFIHSGLNVVCHPLDKDSIIAIIEFTPFHKLMSMEKDDLNFVSTFLHDSKRFISPVASSSRVWGGLMWAIGWRKSYDENQMFGRYIKQFGPEDWTAFDSHYRKSSRVGEIIGNLFKNLAQDPFRKNQNLMKKFNLPSFADLSYGEFPEDSTCSPHITFTTKIFFNPPPYRF